MRDLFLSGLDRLAFLAAETEELAFFYLAQVESFYFQEWVIQKEEQPGDLPFGNIDPITELLKLDLIYRFYLH